MLLEIRITKVVCVSSLEYLNSVVKDICTLFCHLLLKKEEKLKHTPNLNSTFLSKSLRALSVWVVCLD